MDPKPKRQTRAPSFRIEFPGESDIKQNILEGFTKIKGKLNSAFHKQHNNSDVLMKIVADWIAQNDEGSNPHGHAGVSEEEDMNITVEHVDSDEDLMVVERKPFRGYTEAVENHAYLCKKRLRESVKSVSGHVTSL